MPAKKNKHIDELCEIWASEIQTILERSAIAYPSISTIARINEGGHLRPGSICPEVILSRRASGVDIFYKGLRKRHQKIMLKRYFRRDKLSSTEYYHLDNIHQNLADFIPNYVRAA